MRKFIVMLTVFLVGLSVPVLGADLRVLTAQSYSLQSSVRIDRVNWDYSYKMTVKNNGGVSLPGVCGMVTSSSPTVRVRQNTVCFPEIPARSSRASTGTFTLRIDRTYPFNTSSLTWNYRSLTIVTEPEEMAMREGSEHNGVSYWVTMSTTLPPPTHVSFSRSLSSGVTSDLVPPSGWDATENTTWLVTEELKGTSVGDNSVTVRATIGTSQTAEVTIPVTVTEAPPPPRFGSLRAWPAGIPAGGAPVLFTVPITGIEPPQSVLLEQKIDNDWYFAGWLRDDGANGDGIAGDAIYSASLLVSVLTPQTIPFRVTGQNMNPSDSFNLTITPLPVGTGNVTGTISTPDEGAVALNYILVSFVPNTPVSTIETIISSLPGGQIDGFLAGVNFYHIKVNAPDSATLNAILATLRANPNVVSAQPDHIGTPLPTQVGTAPSNPAIPFPNDPSYVYQWGPQGLGGSSIWRISRGQGVIVAVLDFGVDYDHPDFKDWAGRSRVIKGTNYTVPVADARRNDPMDDFGHGTHIAGIIGATGNNGAGIAGLAWDSQIKAIKVCSLSLGCTASNLAYGIYEATASGAKIISISIALAQPNDAVEAAIRQAVAAGKIVIIGAGNNGNSNVVYPAAYLGSLSVAATTSSNALWSGSTRGSWVGVAAPGQYIYSLAPGSGYNVLTGTSMAAPHVAGTAALLWSIRPHWSANQVKARLLSTVDPLGSVASGRLNTLAALTLPGTPDTTFAEKGFTARDGAAGGIGHDDAWSCAIESSGKIVAAGYSQAPDSSMQMALYRYLSTGVADAPFGGYNTGATTSSYGQGGNSVVLDGSGKILVAGQDGSQMVIWRYLTTGDLDLTFGTGGTGGIVLENTVPGSTGGIGQAIAVDLSGRILVSGWTTNEGNPYTFVRRFNGVDGSPDATFGTGGVALIDAAGGWGNSLAIETSSGRILVTGLSNWNSVTGRGDLAIWCLNSNGTLDASFGSNGLVSVTGGQGYSIKLDSFGHILVAGYKVNSSNIGDMALWRFDATNGAPDPSFGSGGVVTRMGESAGTSWDGLSLSGRGLALVVDVYGRIVVSGENWTETTNSDMLLCRYLANGNPDEDFGPEGCVKSNGAAGGNGDDAGYSVALDLTGKIVVSGRSWNGASNDMVIWRYLP
jgi:thermitase